MHHYTYLYSSSTSTLRRISTSGSALNPSQIFGIEDYLSPNTSFGESLIHCAISHTYLYSRSISALRRLYTSIRAQDISGVLTVNIISHPIVRLGSHSFSTPFCVLVFAPKNSGASIQHSATSTAYKYPRSRPLVSTSISAQDRSSIYLAAKKTLTQ